MVTCAPSLIGGKDNQRIVANLQLFEPPHDPADIGVHAGNQSGVGMLGLAIVIKTGGSVILPGIHWSVGETGKLRIVIVFTIFFWLVVIRSVRRIEWH